MLLQIGMLLCISPAFFFLEELLNSKQERMKVRELISDIGPIPILIPLKLLLVTNFKFQKVISFELLNIFFSLLRSV